MRVFIYLSEDFTRAMLHVQSLFLVNHASENRSVQYAEYIIQNLYNKTI